MKQNPRQLWWELIAGPGPLWVRALRWSQRNVETPDTRDLPEPEKADKGRSVLGALRLW